MKITACINKIFPSENKVRAVASLTIDGCFAVHGLKIIDSPKGRFVAMPNEKIHDEYRDFCHPVTKEARQQIIDTVLNAYEYTLQQSKEESRQPEKEQESTAPDEESEPAYSQAM